MKVVDYYKIIRLVQEANWRCFRDLTELPKIEASIALFRLGGWGLVGVTAGGSGDGQSCKQVVSWYLGYRKFLAENLDIFK